MVTKLFYVRELILAVNFSVLARDRISDRCVLFRCKKLDLREKPRTMAKFTARILSGRKCRTGLFNSKN